VVAARKFRLVRPWSSAVSRVLPTKDRHLGNLRILEAGHIRHLFYSQIAGVAVTKIYVGNLPFDATEESVRALFAAHGTVEKLSLVTDRETGRPRGFGFVEMSNADASRAMQALNGKDMDGRALKINEAQDKPRGGGGGGGGRY
jgi:RNA recognition motif-containing protein